MHQKYCALRTFPDLFYCNRSIIQGIEDDAKILIIIIIIIIIIG